MNRAHLRWWLFSCGTFAVLAVAGIFGFYRLLWEQDITRIGFGILAAYVVITAWIGIKIRRGDCNLQSQTFLSAVIEKLGIVGTFIGLCIAFQAMKNMDSAGLWKQELLAGVSTKFLCSIVAIVVSIFLTMQIRIIEADNGEE